MKKRSLSSMIALALCLTLALGVAATAVSTVTKTLTATYADIKLVVNGVAVTPTDANGATVEPFACDGTTYLPVRAVANALGQDVKWDGETKTIYIGEIPGQGTNWMKKLPPYQVGWGTTVYDGSSTNQYFTVAGVKHTVGVVLSDFYRADPYAIWNTNLQYRSMTFSVGHVDDADNGSTTLFVYVDGEQTKEIPLNWDDPVKTYTIPLNYGGNVKLALRGDDSDYGIFDISFEE